MATDNCYHNIQIVSVKPVIANIYTLDLSTVKVISKENKALLESSIQLINQVRSRKLTGMLLKFVMATINMYHIIQIAGVKLIIASIRLRYSLYF